MGERVGEQTSATDPIALSRAANLVDSLHCIKFCVIFGVVFCNCPTLRKISIMHQIKLDDIGFKFEK